jgi:SMI1 / KNR4 family (SUKH-1)
VSVTFHPADERPSEAEVIAFEREIGFALPAGYRAFLLTYNGGKFPHLVSVAPDPEAEGQVHWYLEFDGQAKPPVLGHEDRFILHSFYGLCRTWRDPIRDLREVYKASLEWAHPRELLPIGHDPGNNKYFLCLCGPRGGAILLAGAAYGEKYVQEQYDAITPDDYSLLTESFEAFLAALQWCAHRLDPAEPPERVSHPTRGHIFVWLRSDNTAARIAGLRSIERRGIEIEAFWSEFPRLLRDSNADVRWLTADLLLKHAHNKNIGPFVPHLEALFDDYGNPSWLRSAKGDGFALARVARRAVARYCLHFREIDRLRELIAEGDRAAVDALGALRSASEVNLIAPLLPDLAEAQRAPEESLRQSAATALAHFYWLNQHRDQLRSLLLSEDEVVRLGAISKLDDLAEEGRDQDVEPLLPELLAFFTRRDTSNKKTRQAAARVLAWLVMNKQPHKKDALGLTDIDVPRSFLLNGVDVMGIPEVRANLEDP